ncbi:MAG: polysaccharide biosynthesis protein [Kiritimatiellae bacterium]|nr:polysaccharide biosynthesis protein [Kiritimatiellia bacterium]
MIDFDIEAFVRKCVTRRAESLLEADLARFDAAMHAGLDGRRLLVVGGAGTIGSNYVKAALRRYRPAAVYVVDIDENQLTELTRELRSGDGYAVPAEYVTEPIDLGGALFGKFFRARGPFHVVANFAARKHVRAERDVHSIETMCETNVFMAKRLLDLLLENPPEAFFCVSTDKAANPVNVMGATKKLMEETIMAYAGRLNVKTARFANVAFSNGSLPAGWLNRIAKKQPLSCPLGIRRFFVSPVESGELCLAASVLADSGDIVYPKLDPARDMIPFEAVARDLLRETGLGCRECASTEEAKRAMAERLAGGGGGYPVEFFGSDTDGEKPFEEFYTGGDVRDEGRFVSLGAVKNAKRRPVAEVEGIFAALRAVFDREGASKEDVVAALEEYLPDFRHVDRGKSLDGRM